MEATDSTRIPIHVSGSLTAPRISVPAMIAIWCSVLFLYGIATGPLYRTESLRAIIGRECLHGHWLFPVLYGEPFLTKPPGHYVAIGLCRFLRGNHRRYRPASLGYCSDSCHPHDLSAISTFA